LYEESKNIVVNKIKIIILIKL
jgi:hypothetical protein